MCLEQLYYENVLHRWDFGFVLTSMGEAFGG